METAQVGALLAEMTLAEKVGQMTQAANEAITPGEVADLAIGSVLSGGNGVPSPNTPEAWADMVGSFVAAAQESRLGVPLVYGVDAVHGHGLVPGATVFPHNIGLGAAGDAGLVERIGRATRAEVLATGIRWTFAPCVAVPHDVRWGRTYEGYGRDPELVARLGGALVQGLQAPSEHPPVLACPKHFVGDGGTSWGTVAPPTWVDWWDGWRPSWQIDQGDARCDEAELRRRHLLPYEAAIAAGAGTVMASYSSWNGQKLHGHRHLLTDVLKGELAFGGFVVSDWMGVQQLDPSFEDSVVTSVNAGVDMVMVPIEFRRFVDALTAAVRAGRVPMRRIDDAVGRILRAKAAIGLFDGPTADPVPLAVLGSGEHRALAAEAARRGAVLLKGDGALPLRPPPERLVVAGAAADDIGLQCGGWTAGWQGSAGPITDGTTLLDALRAALSDRVDYAPDGSASGRHRVGIVCIAEPPYAEGIGDRAVPTASDQDRAVFARMRARCDTLILIVYSGRPLVIPALIEAADAVVAAWLPGSEATALPGLLLGHAPFTGRLPQPWPTSREDLEAQTGRPLEASA